MADNEEERSELQEAIDMGFVEGPIPPDLLAMEQRAREAREQFQSSYAFAMQFIRPGPHSDGSLPGLEVMKLFAKLTELHRAEMAFEVYRAQWLTSSVIGRSVKSLAEFVGAEALRSDIPDTIDGLFRKRPPAADEG